MSRITRVHIRRLREGKISQVDIAAEIGVTPQRVGQILTEMGVPRAERVRWRTVRIGALAQELREQGLSWRQVAARLGLASSQAASVYARYARTEGDHGKRG